MRPTPWIRSTFIVCLASFSLGLALPASGQRHEFRASSGTLENGLEITQHVNSTSFPAFKGSPLERTENELPGVSAPNALRSVRILMPIDDRRRANFVMTAPNSGVLAGDINGATLTMQYTGPLLSDNPNPFLVIDTRVQVSSNASRSVWTERVLLSRPISANATHVLVTAFVLPKLNDEPSMAGSANIVIGLDEAAVFDDQVIATTSLARNIILTLDESIWAKWRQLPIRGGSYASLDAMGGFPHGDAAVVAQRVRPLLGEAKGPRRERRCVDDFLYALGLHFLEVAFGRSSLCSFDPIPHDSPAHPLPLIDITPLDEPPPAAAMVPYEALVGDKREHAFDAAVGIAFCNDNHENPAESQSDMCTIADRDAIAAINELSLNELRALRDQAAGLGSSSEGGLRPLHTGNAALDRWLNADRDRANNLIDAAAGVTHQSDLGADLAKPRKSKREGKLLKASCIDTQSAEEGQEMDETPWQQCARKSKAKLNDSAVIVAVTPRVQTGGGYHLRGTPEFERLVRSFKNSERTPPAGLLGAEFGRHTRAIAVDVAETGDNLGLVFLNDPVEPPGNTQRRFKYGIEHIWASGAGGGDNDGHRGDWNQLPGLPVNSRELLTDIIMAALTDLQADYTQQRQRNGNLVRTFRQFTFRQGETVYRITNIRVVLGQNGMVVTAFPKAGARANRLSM
ncbi:MAG: hypothetical protein QOI13_1606 [Paraburkholderia sp.]|nr:hypothetical protein [Paraburkholderia sp.]